MNGTTDEDRGFFYSTVGLGIMDTYTGINPYPRNVYPN